MGAGVTLQPSAGALREQGADVFADLRVILRAATDTVTGILIGCKVFFCQDQDVCLFEEVYFKVPVGEELSSSAGGAVLLSYALSPKAQTVDFPGL